MKPPSRWHLTAMISAVSLVVALWPGASQLLEFDRVAVGGGDWWRILTGHLAHFGFEHLVWDAGVFAVLGVICERRHRTATLACLGAATVLIPAATWLLVPEITTYRGLSGLDTALFALLGVMMCAESWRQGRHGRTTMTVLLLLGMVLKIGWEFYTDGGIFVRPSSDSFVPVPLVHLVGAVVGLAVAMGQSFCSNFVPPRVTGGRPVALKLEQS
jgi:rhomboid family GlyGly-CTERM serine protease